MVARPTALPFPPSAVGGVLGLVILLASPYLYPIIFKSDHERRDRAAKVAKLDREAGAASERGDYDAAIDLGNQMLALAPNVSDGFLRRGEALLAKRQLDQPLA